MWAIVPLKSLDQAKQRLASVLDAAERRGLMLAMARDVLTALRRASRPDGILLVSRTPEADALAQAFDTERFAEAPDADLAEALRQASRHLADNHGATGVMVVPADVPLIGPDEVDALLAAHRQVTLVPDSDNRGTNCLVCSPPDAVPFVFDGASFRPHFDAALARGITPVLRPSAGFALDIDRPADLLTLLARAPSCQTAVFLEQSGIAERLKKLDLPTLQQVPSS